MRVSLDERNGNDVVRAVRDGVADLGVVWDVVDREGLSTARYRSDHLGVLLRSSHPLARRERIRIAETLAYPSVGVSPGESVSVPGSGARGARPSP